MREYQPKGDEAAASGGARWTLSFVIGCENQADVGTFAQRFIVPGTSITVDESDAYDVLHDHFPMRRVNHTCAYRAVSLDVV